MHTYRPYIVLVSKLKVKNLQKIVINIYDILIFFFLLFCLRSCKICMVIVEVYTSIPFPMILDDPHHDSDSRELKLKVICFLDKFSSHLAQYC